jgi:hypothetical protein
LGLSTPKALTPAQRRSLAASDERHIEPRAAPKGVPTKPAMQAKEKTEGGNELQMRLASNDEDLTPIRYVAAP